MEEQNMLAVLEAILFAAGEPLETDRIAQTMQIPALEVYNLTQLLQDRYTQTGSALQLLHLGNAWQIGTRAEFAPMIRAVLETKRMQPLSNAAMEALTIVAYNQPVSKGFVERVRGIDSSSVVNSLVDKGLLEEAGRIDVPGHPIAYRTTPLFLRAFGLTSLDELPDPYQPEQFTGEIADVQESDE